MLNVTISTCGVMKDLKAGEKYDVKSPGFPYEYEGENHCKWEIKGYYVTTVNCSIEMPVYHDSCTEENFSILFDGENDAQQYCGRGTIFLKGINPTIKLDTPRNSRKGRFSCEIQAENKTNCKCGWKKETRIVGGTETGVNEYPMMCGLVDSTKNGNESIFCGGTIIAESYVLTAAHCVKDRDISTIGVVVGEHDVTTGTETNATKLFRIVNCIMHEHYNDNHNDNDIAICKINGTIEYSAEVGPACLPFQHRDDTFGGDIVTALGWGMTEFGGSKAHTLQKVKLNVINPGDCAKYDSDVTDKNICTYTQGKDTCQMDSGGPDLWENPTTSRQIICGITSSGRGCGSNPAINTRVGKFIGWIVSVTRDANYCQVE
ncbi:venom serine protease 34-like [Nylanderia fulva]|uniref:venom serine protease 34-like n=1 Tax=Nylanderia fulva TaxID=613905 RepID=UPI0010FB136B|nr:venom serine protease 34-like [Nylanderia fulva]